MMKNEIGSEFWSVPVSKEDTNFFPKETKWFLSGRSALCSIINTIKQSNNNFHTVALPSWCCDSVILPFQKAGIRVVFYDVIGAEQKINNICTDALFVMDYFGYSGYSRVPNGYKGFVIRDVTHSVFIKRYSDSDFYFGSLRKWCGMWTGGFAWGNTKLIEAHDEYPQVVQLRKRAMLSKAKYIYGEKNDKAYLKVFSEAEEALDSLNGVYAADERDIRVASKIDVELIRKKRRSNAEVLMDALKKYCIFPELKKEDCPLFVPIYVENRDKLRQKLIEKQIYCPVHWPITPSHIITSEQKQIYQSELSIVCDQRYGRMEMERIIDVIEKELKETC